MINSKPPVRKKILKTNEFDVLTDCNLCWDMEWDEAIYCPKCFGEGKIIVESKDKEFSKEERDDS